MKGMKSASYGAQWLQILNIRNTEPCYARNKNHYLQYEQKNMCGCGAAEVNLQLALSSGKVRRDLILSFPMSEGVYKCLTLMYISPMASNPITTALQWDAITFLRFLLTR